MKTVKRIHVAESPLEKAVQRWINSTVQDGGYNSGVEGVLKDLFYGGCESGMVGHLTYYADTCKFYKRHQKEIDGMLCELMADCGVDGPSGLFKEKWDKDDPLARDTLNQNLLAWFGFEETARKLADKAGIEV